MVKGTKPTKRLYWDACVFLSVINENADRTPVIQTLFDAADAGDIAIYTSYLSITEVAFAESEKVNILLDDKIQERIGKLWEPPSIVNLIEINPFVILI